MRFSYIGRKVNRCFAQKLHQNRMPEINRCICWEAKFFPHIHTHNGGKGKRGSLINGGKCNHIARSGENKATKQRAASRMDGKYFNPVLGGSTKIHQHINRRARTTHKRNCTHGLPTKNALNRTARCVHSSFVQNGLVRFTARGIVHSASRLTKKKGEKAHIGQSVSILIFFIV